jgi:hypothetical protein
VSELKSISGSSRLPYGTLALGAEGIKNAIKSFDDACVPSLIFYPFVLAVLNIGLFVDANRISITSACPQLRSDRHRRHQPRPHPVVWVPARMWVPVPVQARARVQAPRIQLGACHPRRLEGRKEGCRRHSAGDGFCLDSHCAVLARMLVY